MNSRQRYKGVRVRVTSKMRDLLEHAALGGPKGQMGDLLGPHARVHVSKAVTRGLIEVRVHLTDKGREVLSTVREREQRLINKRSESHG